MRLATNRRQILAGLSAVLATALLAPGAAQAGGDLAEIFRPVAEGSEKTVDHSAWSELLGRYVVAGQDGVNRVDYARFKADGHPALKSYVAELEKVDPRRLDRAEQFAFWANLYNAKTIDIVLDNYPVRSIRDISIDPGLLDLLKKSVGAGGPWKAPVVTVAGQRLSLDNIEHDIMRPIFKDPRVHYSVNCASYGCPNLMREAFTGAALDAQLDAGARAFVNHPRGVTVANGTVTASSIYNWFVVDFGGTAAGVLDHLRKYAGPELKAALAGARTIDSYAYDWSLNDTSAPQG